MKTKWLPPGLTKYGQAGGKWSMGKLSSDKVWAVRQDRSSESPVNVKIFGGDKTKYI